MFEALGIIIGLSLGCSITAFIYFAFVYETHKNDPEVRDEDINGPFRTAAVKVPVETGGPRSCQRQAR
jgi:hypothetical protein